MRFSQTAYLILLSFVLAYSSAVGIVMDHAMMAGDDVDPLGAVVVLGKKTASTTPDFDFQQRIDRLATLLEEFGQLHVIASGAAASGGMSEASIIASAVPQYKVVLEEHARSTRENLLLSSALTEIRQPLNVITSRYHLARTAAIAHNMDLSVSLMPAEDKWVWSVNNMLAVSREALLYWPSRMGA